MPDLPLTAQRRAAAKQENEAQAVAHFSNYAEYNKTVRTWFVSFGIAGMALLLTNPSLFEQLSIQNRRCVVYGFLVATGCQVIDGFINKSAAWYMYAGSASPDLRATTKYKFWEWITQQYWIDLLADLASILCFGGVAYLFAMAKLLGPTAGRLAL